MTAKDQENPGEHDQGFVVFMIRRETRCAECGEELWPGRLLRLEKKEPLCLECADLGHLEFLPAGNTAVTRRATRYSKLKVVVVQWSRTRKRYERQGILAEPAAIQRAEEESLADAEVRARRQERAALRREAEDRQYVADFARAVRQHYPGCSEEEAQQIAAHACRKHSGRIGRTAAAKEFDAEAIGLAVRAHVRHVHTNYDELLCRYEDRGTARWEVHEQVESILRQWQGSGG
jgi:hypothetical protein